MMNSDLDLAVMSRMNTLMNKQIRKMRSILMRKNMEARPKATIQEKMSPIISNEIRVIRVRIPKMRKLIEVSKENPRMIQIELMVEK